MELHQSLAAVQAHLPFLASRGITFDRGMEPLLYVSDDPKRGMPLGLALDALPTLTTEANAGVPTMYLNIVDPKTFDILFSPMKVAEIFDGEEQRGSWEDISAMFPAQEFIGEPTSYDDYAKTGVAGVNLNWPQRENYLWQIMITYGDLEVARAARANVNLIAAKQNSAAFRLNKFGNGVYAFGVTGLQNYGSTNDPGLSASLTPAPKAYGGTAWISGGVIRATANEVFTDIQSIVTQAILQGNGNITTSSPMRLALPAQVSNALTATNAFGVNVRALLKENYPQMQLIEGVQEYAQTSATNPLGIAAGNLVQLVIPEVATQKTGTPVYSDKMRTHRLVTQTSFFEQKRTSGSFGTIIRQPFAIASMVGV